MKPVFTKLKELDIGPRTSSPEAVDLTEREQENLSRILERANQLRLEWSQHEYGNKDESAVRPAGQPRRRTLEFREPAVQEREVQPQEEVEEIKGRPTIDEVAHAVMTLRATMPNRGRKNAEDDPLTEALSKALSTEAFTCRKCVTSRRLWIGKKGPFLKCSTTSCLPGESLGVESVRQAFEQLRPKCKCGQLVQVIARGSTLSEPKCLTCSTIYHWQVLREHLREKAARN
jgi:hypothetical protein